ncbi:MAG: Smr/MutS family protein [Bacteroidales bacterium]|nr:Smr/MutS family protein [Bacteroidales bacterium]
MTTVKPGDLVRFIDAVGEGRVRRIISKDLAEVETTDGWVLPTYIKTLVVIPENISPTYAPIKSKRVEEPIPQKVDKGLLKNVAERPAVSKPSGNKMPVREIDLHINKLIDSVVGLSNTEILMLQLDKFRQELNQSIRNHEREIIFIHGIGNGTLKNELRRVADQEYKWCSLEDASFKEYGFGATRIRIPQNKPF